jgi:hypothetical protein
MSGNRRRIHRVRGVSSGSPENHWVPWLIHKAKTEEPKMEVQQHQTGLTGGSDRSDRCATTESGILHRDPWLASRLSRVRSPGIRPMEKI